MRDSDGGDERALRGDALPAMEKGTRAAALVAVHAARARVTTATPWWHIDITRVFYCFWKGLSGPNIMWRHICKIEIPKYEIKPWSYYLELKTKFMNSFNNFVKRCHTWTSLPLIIIIIIIITLTIKMWRNLWMIHYLAWYEPNNAIIVVETTGKQNLWQKILAIPKTTCLTFTGKVSVVIKIFVFNLGFYIGALKIVGLSCYTKGQKMYLLFKDFVLFF